MKIFILTIITLLVSSPAISQENAAPLSPAEKAAQAEEQARINALTPPETPKPDWMSYKEPYTEKQDLAKPHRSNEEIQQWALKAITDLFYLTPTTYKDSLTSAKNYFEKPSWTAYAKHLKSSQYLDLVTNQGYSTEAILKDTLEIISHEARNGAYHWTIKANVVASTFILGADNKKNILNSTNYTVFADIKRVEKSADDMNLVISEIRFDKTLME